MQEKSQSAVLRIKESLSYKLGSTLIEYNKAKKANLWGGGNLFIKLLKLKKTHQRTQILYKDFISLYPHLQYPPLEQCSDYKEALKYKFHLSYLLGAALIKANKTWYKGGYIKLYSEIQKAKQTYKEFKALDEEHILESHYLALIFENKDKLKLFKEYKEEFKTLLNDFNHYEALSTSLKQALAYDLNFISQNLNIIKEWLYSKEFKENYQDKKHPYPSLLNPEKIDYNSISASLAWEMNLPLPRRYEFIFVLMHGAGGTSMTHYLGLCGVNLNRLWGNGDFQYQDSYKLLMKDKTLINGVIVSSSNYDGTRDKHIKLTNKEAPILCIVRDPISILKHTTNHMRRTIKESLRNFGLDTPMQNLFDFEFTTRYLEVGLEALIKNHSNKIKEHIFYVNDFLNQASKIYYIPMEDIVPPKTYDTLLFLSKELGFSKPKKFAAFERKINSANHLSDGGFFPRTFQVSTAHNIQIHLEITKEQDKKEDFIECIKLFSQSDFLINEIKARVYCSKEHFTLLDKEKELLNKVKAYLIEYFIKMEEFYYKEKAKLVNEKDILECLKKDKISTLAYKKRFDKEYAHLKATRPDIVASWKYYQEFEKMCEEGDK